MNDEDFFERASEPIARRVVTGLAKVGMALRSQAVQAAAGSRLSATQGQALALLDARGPLRLNALAEALGVTAATASDSVRALVDKGLVEKERDPEDGRAVRLRLTAEGGREAARSAGWPDFLLGAVDALSPPEQEVFLLGLVKMIRALQAQGRIPLARMCATCRYFRPFAHRESPDRPHHCAFVDAPLGPRHLRLDCAEHEAAGEAAQKAVWDALTAR